MDWLDILRLMLEASLPALLALMQNNSELTKRNLGRLDSLQSEWREEMRQQALRQDDLQKAVAANDHDIKELLAQSQQS